MNTPTRILYGLGLPLSPLKPLFKNFRGRWSSYRPFLQPWREDALFQDYLAETKGVRIYSEETLYQVCQFARVALRAEGDVWECGVYRGGTSVLLARLIAGTGKRLHLFDTFTGLPEASEMDKYKVGELGDTSLASVEARVREFPFAKLHPGFMPDTFAGLEQSTICFALVDVDQQESTKACLEFIYPRLSAGGAIVIDDYGRPGTYGCRVAVDEYLAEVGATIVVLNTGQGVVFKCPARDAATTA
jgi:hypothetical protein